MLININAASDAYSDIPDEAYIYDFVYVFPIVRVRCAGTDASILCQDPAKLCDNWPT